ncbi:hypothetical protein VSH64_23235 [Amycolatopsis rhabdoformis]|uniref:DUF5666 domain-containing protein n=1 Tax=Amycolatopsis rhabdoformis TaxID=1448059 RepID=A0ABZ1IMK0_9PSEU|nr:hypothetical protein [Amycolatopsis rhabdoformis]WSE34956.1 hypothetical protein VSH64_23235 [Amycolatopsis rhabdoformis]
MTTEPSTQDPRTAPNTWGAATSGPTPPPHRKWIAVGVAAVVVVGGGGAIWIATSSADSGTATAAGPGMGQGGQGGPGLGGPGLGQALHGEFVTTDDNGAFVTKFLQTGKVTALSATSLTAQSDDGFTKIYTIDSATATGITNGEQVTIIATASGDTATATSVTEARDANAGPPSP